jgi:hypothetical protein
VDRLLLQVTEQKIYTVMHHFLCKPLLTLLFTFILLVTHPPTHPPGKEYGTGFTRRIGC